MPFEKVELPSGAWAALRDPEQTTEAQRKPAARVQIRIGLDKELQAVFAALQSDDPSAASQSELSDAQIDLMSDYMDATTVALIEEWSFDQPVTVDGLRSIPGKKDYEALVLAAGKHREALFPSFDIDKDPESPTPASAD